MAAAVHRVPLPVVVDAHRATTEPAPHTTGQQILATSLAGPETAMRGFEVVERDEGLVMARIPLAAEQHLAEVDARQQNVANRSVLDPRSLRNLAVAQVLCA
jgi:hypothetical protein